MEPVYTGKVRNVYDLGGNYLLMEATDKVSSFDRHIGTIKDKGVMLNQMSTLMFDKTRHIIQNHFISSRGNTMLVRKTTPFKIEVIVRGYITGNTNTSLWTHYANGSRNYCGVILPEGLVKNQKLEEPVVTPTTKGEVDEPISREDITAKGYMTLDEVDYVYKKALELFNHGTRIAARAGFILVDTKFEFGRAHDNGEIILIDEVLTCDSSRYWLMGTYNQRFSEGKEPEKLDKDKVRDWVKENVSDPYNEPIPEIPDNIKLQVHDAYLRFYSAICSHHVPRENIAVIFSGSEKDEAHVNKIKKCLTEQNIHYVSYVASAHKKPRLVLDLIQTYDKNVNFNKVAYITVAGRSNALSGVVAANSIRPVIACPPFGDKDDMMVNINSTLQCPSNVPVMTILEPSNVALSIKRIFS
jgi:phosphoribosylaminoimidazole-succinocarboxamide synthase